MADGSPWIGSIDGGGGSCGCGGRAGHLILEGHEKLHRHLCERVDGNVSMSSVNLPTESVDVKLLRGWVDRAEVQPTAAGLWL